MLTTDAEAREGQPYVDDPCLPGILLGTQADPASVEIQIYPSSADVVTNLAAESRSNGVGLFFC
jgi:hypothetical protein